MLSDCGKDKSTRRTMDCQVLIEKLQFGGTYNFHVRKSRVEDISDNTAPNHPLHMILFDDVLNMIYKCDIMM
jgi:hypothetical protein